MKLLLKVVGVLLVLVVLAAAGGYAWISSATSRVMSRTFDVHTVDFPVPFPLDPAEVEALGLTEEEAARVAMERAIERGRHLVEARYACAECHGENFGGGVMIDAPPIGRIYGANLTRGAGSRTLNYTTADWDRTVRHGVLPDGRPTPMPAEDFRLMSDQELSDIITYIQSLPPVDNEVPPPVYGPLGKFLVATGQFKLSADIIGSHEVRHPELPPEEAPTVEFGRHLAATCTGCHNQNLTGGPITGGDPSWPPARNLTPDASGLAGWTLQDFVRVMREGVRPDGTPIQPPMTFVLPFAQRMRDVELEALFVYLQSLPPMLTGQ